MKKMILGVLCAVISLSVSAQAIREGEMALVYYMPQTQMVIDVEYETVILHRGIYSEYAKQYLGSAEVVSDDDMWYRMTDIHTRLQTAADYTRMCKVTDYPLLLLSRKGTLLGYNIAAKRKDSNSSANMSTGHSGSGDPNALHRSLRSSIHAQEEESKGRLVLPLFEEHLAGKSLAEQAHGAAKLIYRIRENRMYLVGGEVDKVPADGRAMELALNKLDEMERELVELFIGRIEVVKHKKSFTYVPVKTEEVDLAYFSETQGFTTSESGDAIKLSITARRQTKGHANVDNKKKAPQPSQIFYNLPGSATYKITYLNEVRAEGEIPVAQFGVSVPLAQDLFNGKEQPQIRFNPQTGNIESIEY